MEVEEGKKEYIATGKRVMMMVEPIWTTISKMTVVLGGVEEGSNKRMLLSDHLYITLYTHKYMYSQSQ